MNQEQWDKWMSQITFVDPGQKVFYPVPGQNIIVPAIVEEVNDIYSHIGDYGIPASGLEYRTLWVNRYLNGHVEMRQATPGVVGENGWEVFRDVSFDELFDYRMVNQFVWLDEPTYGHEIQVGDECFLTLAEAMKYICPGSKRHLKRRLNNHRRRNNKFVSSTWIAAGQPTGPIFPKYPPKKIYALRAR